MACNNEELHIQEHETFRSADIFTARWKALALLYAVHPYLYAGLRLFGWLLYAGLGPFGWLLLRLLRSPLTLVWEILGMLIMLVINEQAPTLFWFIRLYTTSLDEFENDFRQAWQDELMKSHNCKVVGLNIFVSGNAMSVPVAFDKEEPENNSDAETFKQLLMWYSWMQFKEGLGGMIMPRRLVRVDKVKFCSTSLDLGKRIKTYNLGHNATSNIVNFLDPSRMDAMQHFQTDSMLSNTDAEGLVFIHVWDRSKVSIICMIPFVVSLLFAIIWISVSVTRFAVDAQVAVQTAFTVASYIVTAGALSIALFAFFCGRVKPDVSFLGLGSERALKRSKNRSKN